MHYRERGFSALFPAILIAFLVLVTIVTLKQNITPTIPYGSHNPSSDQSISWKSYTNNQYGFSFLYPPDWKLSDINYVWLSRYVNNAHGDIVIFPGRVKVTPSTKLDKSWLEKNAGVFWGENTAEVLLEATISTTKILGYPALQVIDPPQESGGNVSAPQGLVDSRTDIFTNLNGVLYQFTYSVERPINVAAVVNGQSLEEYTKTTFDQILPTLKFTP